RAVGEYASYFGFDVSLQNERLFALNILGLASSGSAASKGLAMAQLVRIAQDAAKKKAWKVLEQHAFVQVIQQISKALGIRLTKDKLARLSRSQAQSSAEDSTPILSRTSVRRRTSSTGRGSWQRSMALRLSRRPFL